MGLYEQIIFMAVIKPDGMDCFLDGICLLKTENAMGQWFIRNSKAESYNTSMMQIPFSVPKN